jgi:hypothetical protein
MSESGTILLEFVESYHDLPDLICPVSQAIKAEYRRLDTPCPTYLEDTDHVGNVRVGKGTAEKAAVLLLPMG